MDVIAGVGRQQIAVSAKRIVRREVNFTGQVGSVGLAGCVAQCDGECVGMHDGAVQSLAPEKSECASGGGRLGGKDQAFEFSRVVPASDACKAACGGMTSGAMRGEVPLACSCIAYRKLASKGAGTQGRGAHAGVNAGVDERGDVLHLGTCDLRKGWHALLQPSLMDHRPDLISF